MQRYSKVIIATGYLLVSGYSLDIEFKEHSVTKLQCRKWRDSRGPERTGSSFFLV